MCLTVQRMTVHINHTSSTYKSFWCSDGPARVICHTSSSPALPPRFASSVSLIATSSLILFPAREEDGAEGKREEGKMGGVKRTDEETTQGEVEVEVEEEARW